MTDMTDTVDSARIAADLKGFKERLAEIDTERNRLHHEISRLEAAVEVLREYGPHQGAQPSARYTGMTIADAIEKYLGEVGGTAKLTDIRDDLVRGGLLAGKPETRYGTLVQTMRRNNARFEQAGKGLWKLRGSSNGRHPESELSTGGSPVTDLGVPVGI